MEINIQREKGMKNACASIPFPHFFVLTEVTLTCNMQVISQIWIPNINPCMCLYSISTFFVFTEVTLTCNMHVTDQIRIPNINPLYWKWICYKVKVDKYKLFVECNLHVQTCVKESNTEILKMLAHPVVPHMHVSYCK